MLNTSWVVSGYIIFPVSESLVNRSYQHCSPNLRHIGLVDQHDQLNRGILGSSLVVSYVYAHRCREMDWSDPSSLATGWPQYKTYDGTPSHESIVSIQQEYLGNTRPQPSSYRTGSGSAVKSQDNTHPRQFLLQTVH